MLRSPALGRGSRAHALAGPGARRPGARRSGGRSCRRPGQPAPDASQDGLSHRLRYGWRAGGLAGRGTEPAPRETSGFEYVCGAVRQGAEPLGSGTQVHGKGRMLGNQEAGTCQLSLWGPQKAHIGELRGSRKIPLSVEFSQGTRGVRFCLGFEPWT